MNKIKWLLPDGTIMDLIRFIIYSFVLGGLIAARAAIVFINLGG